MKIYSISVFIILNIFLKNSTCENLKLLILHNNDMHSRFEETSRTSGTCKDKANCYGGFARVLHVIREARKAAADGTGPPVLYLNAGDTYTGTSWFSVHKWKIAADFMNLLHPDVASFGNHEFDYKPAGIVPFLNAVNFPVVAANVDFSREPLFKSTNVTKSYVMEIAGEKIGVIGYVLPSTATISSPGEVIFNEEVEAIKAESELLNSKGVKIIIAVGHSGFEKDKEIAQKVPLVDLVVGGHTNTFLYNGPQPDLEKPEGPYPVVVQQSSGKKVPVVQAYAYTKYMGSLTITFNDNGDAIGYTGQPLLLNSKVQQDRDGLKLLETFRPAVDAIYKQILGITSVHLDGNMENCRVKECNLANLITDAYVEYHITQYKGEFWTDVPIAMINAGCIRTSMTSRFNSSLTKADIMQALPYDDRLHVVTLNGSDLLKTLEIGVRYKGDTNRGELIHSSGIRYSFDMFKPVGERIVSAKVRCGLCPIPKYEPIVMDKPYRVIVTEFLLMGGDGHIVVKTKSYNRSLESANNIDAIAGYITKHSPIHPEEDERLVALFPVITSASGLPSSSNSNVSRFYLILGILGLRHLL